MRIKYEAIDIFSGCGGVSCGLSLAGFKIKSAVEIEKHAVDTYLNYEPLNRVNVLNEDICNLSGDKILKAAKIKKDDIYLFAGCPPCQNFSRQNPLFPQNFQLLAQIPSILQCILKFKIDLDSGRINFFQ